ncbi:GrpE protein 1, mitochondrial [Podochytrium sp. JEL0797]|nr:GrpE protein 1, mitochondrial [Podochytrium sp. JEL0797]
MSLRACLFPASRVASLASAAMRPSILAPLSIRGFSAEAAKPQEEAAKDEAAKPDEKTAALLADKDKQITDLQDLYRRSLADMENIRQRTKKEVADASSYAVTKFAKDLLETADVLDIALKSVPEADRTPANKQMNEFYQGVDMTRTNLLKSFKRFGIEPYAEDLGIGSKFDHNLHEAIFQAPVPGKTPGSILDVMKKGYMIHGRVLRNAQVGVVFDPDH